MDTQAPQIVPVGPDTLITVKVVIDGTNRRFKLALRDLGAHVLPQKLRVLLAIPPNVEAVFERFSDSAASYVALDSNNPAIYKQLYRAAKAKLKLRIKATLTQLPPVVEPTPNIMDEPQPHGEPLSLPTPPKASPSSRYSYLDTVLSTPREQETQTRRSDNSGAPPASASVPQRLTAVLRPSNPTGEASVEPAKAEPGKTATSDTSAKAKISRLAPQILSDHFCIDCNNCGQSIPDEHYHCGICDDGDFDLCSSCIAADVTCEGEAHWLIKRRIRNGSVVNSVTETIAPKKWQEQKPVENELKIINGVQYVPRTCNSCIKQVPGEEMVTCFNCADYDLCMMCFSLGDHGHHPAHNFQPVSADTSDIKPRVLSLCGTGRGLRHAAICDGCDKQIFGVRHKCLSCPDFDYCSICVLSATHIHPGHRFAALFEQIADLNNRDEVHFGIYCDGPVCTGKPYKQYIRGTRYKCAVCHDTDFCANCEAIPSLDHNRTHPLIKFKTPVRHVSVTTLGEKNNGESMGQMGDRPSARNAATETIPVPNSVSTATQVQTVAEVKPEEVSTAEKTPNFSLPKNVFLELQAWFERDSIADGSRMTPDDLFTQSWTIRNPGPQAWPAGCAVYFTGGDTMLNVDTKNPSSVTTMAAATKSNMVADTVEPGQKAVFSVLLKSPEREGRAISYWRLKTPEGVPFGHKLWVDITVSSAPVGLETEKKPEVVSEVKEEVKEEIKEVKEEAKEAVKEEEEVKEEVKEESNTAEEFNGEESSIMIFPKLDKESPLSSTHGLVDGALSSKGEGKTKAEEDELVEDLESLRFEDEGSEDGFLTDEEYDILDASDEDFLMEAQKALKK